MYNFRMTRKIRVVIIKKGKRKKNMRKYAIYASLSLSTV